ncbi:Bro-N domain-containing protein [Halorhodospira neutriphila]|uniref:Bro-N domain-containing protein n=1 Tax=Halorhodospira neutriphila TaxID=168379 RepID=A0ABS1E3P5_9GAMM|nr:hypothetical protein [Halorhodospira neutriphila]
MRLGMSPGKPMAVISESGLYRLTMRSNKQEARALQDWVTQEVIPSIRKTGGYQLQPGQAMPMPQGFAEEPTGRERVEPLSLHMMVSGAPPARPRASAPGATQRRPRGASPQDAHRRPRLYPLG